MKNPFLDDEKRELAQQADNILDTVFERNKVARYKLELLFGDDFSVTQPSKGILSFWESGTKLHGEGDSLVYQCAGKRIGKNNCEAFIPDSANSYGVLYCVECDSSWEDDDVTSEIMAKLSVKSWAGLLAKYFRLMNHQADIIIKRPPSKLRETAQQEQEKQLLGEKLNRLRTSRVTTIYTLKRILEDTANGSDIESRIEAFLRGIMEEYLRTAYNLAILKYLANQLNPYTRNSLSNHAVPRLYSDECFYQDREVPQEIIQEYMDKLVTQKKKLELELSQYKWVKHEQNNSSNTKS